MRVKCPFLFKQSEGTVSFSLMYRGTVFWHSSCFKGRIFMGFQLGLRRVIRAASEYRPTSLFPVSRPIAPPGNGNGKPDLQGQLEIALLYSSGG